MDTHFASSQRSSKPELQSLYTRLRDSVYITNLLNAMPFMVSILDKNRQLVFSNHALIDKLDFDSLQDIVGERPGELLSCIHADKMSGGCGTSSACKYCGAVISILESQQKQQLVTEECRIEASENGVLKQYEFKATAAPFHFQGHDYTLFTLEDISHEKRRESMERIFFHDIINRAGSLLSFAELLRGAEGDSRLTDKYINALEQVSRDVLEELQFQRDISQAEMGDLMVNKSRIVPNQLLEALEDQMKANPANDRVNIAIRKTSDDYIFTSDMTMLSRVLINMLKNALEASSPEDTVTVYVEKTEDKIDFNVHNQQYIPHDIQMQLFQRSFSSKGTGRGLGTYSMKLFGEKYLGGKVSFVSEKNKGTTFTISLPLT